MNHAKPPDDTNGAVAAPVGVATDRPDFLTTAEVAARYRTADATVRYWRMTGYGPKGVKVGRRVLYAMAEIERFDAELATPSESA